MDDIDHYAILGLSSGEEGATFTLKDIQKAYKNKALELHPDKRPRDSGKAHADFQRLKESYAILKDEEAKKIFHDLLRAKLEKARRHSQQDSKRPKMMSDLERRERDSERWKMMSDLERRERDSKRRKMMSDLERRERDSKQRKMMSDLERRERDSKLQKMMSDLQRIERDSKRRKMMSDLQRIERDSKRRKMMSELERRERDVFAFDPELKTREEDERISRKFNEEVARIKATKFQAAGKVASSTEAPRSGLREKESTSGLDKEMVLKVSWEKHGVDYSAGLLRALFEKFGKVEYVVMRNNKKKGSALVIMASKDAVVACTNTVLGDLSNPLLVLPLQPIEIAATSSTQETEVPRSGQPSGAAYKSFEEKEAAIMDKLRKGFNSHIRPP